MPPRVARSPTFGTPEPSRGLRAVPRAGCAALREVGRACHFAAVRSRLQSWRGCWVSLALMSWPAAAAAEEPAAGLVTGSSATSGSTDVATSGFEAYREAVEPWTLQRGEQETGVPATVIQEIAHAFGLAGAPGRLLARAVRELVNPRNLVGREPLHDRLRRNV